MSVHLCDREGKKNMLCPKCGRVNETNSNFCAFCGMRLFANSKKRTNQSQSNGERPNIKATSPLRTIVSQRLYIYAAVIALFFIGMLIMIRESEKTDPILGRWKLEEYEDSRYGQTHNDVRYNIMEFYDDGSGKMIWENDWHGLETVVFQWENVTKKANSSFVYHFSELFLDSAEIDRDSRDLLIVKGDDDENFLYYKCE